MPNNYMMVSIFKHFITCACVHMWAFLVHAQVSIGALWGHYGSSRVGYYGLGITSSKVSKQIICL